MLVGPLLLALLLVVLAGVVLAILPLDPSMRRLVVILVAVVVVALVVDSFWPVVASGWHLRVGR